MEQVPDIQPPQRKIYKTYTIWAGTFLGGPLVAGYLMAQNFKAFNEPANIKKAWIFAVISTAIVFAGAFLSVDTDRFPRLLIPVLYSGAAYYLTQIYRGKKIIAHIKAGGPVYSIWRTVGVSMFGAVVTLVLFVGTGVLTDEIALKTQSGMGFGISTGKSEKDSIVAEIDKLAAASYFAKSTALYNIYDEKNHLKPDFDKKAFDTLHSAAFCQALLNPIDIAADDDAEITISRRYSPGQKALYFTLYLDEQVTNGGFVQFYCNGYRKYLTPIVAGLKLVGDDEMLKLVEHADRQFIANKKMFDEQVKKGEWKPLYDELKELGVCDQLYYKINSHMMELIEKYARKHSDEFVNLK